MSDADRQQDTQAAPARRPLVVKPIFSYPLPQRAEQTSWRAWGGMQNRQDVADETVRIHRELEGLAKTADFPLTFLPLAVIRRPNDLAPHQQDISGADALLFYAGGDGGGDLMANVNHIDRLGKNVIVFVRHQSGPLYYWYEGAMARLLHQHTDALATRSIGYEDVVIDRMDEVLWRLRGLCGLRNTLGSRLLAVGNPANGDHAQAVESRWKLEVQTVSRDDFGKILQNGRSDRRVVDLAHQETDAYLRLPETKLETDRKYVESAVLLEHVLRSLMQQTDCRAAILGGCIDTILPAAQTTPCLAVSRLNDAGCLAFCQCQLAEAVAGLLLGNIAGRPVFQSKPTFPHDQCLLLAHCTAPRRMDGATAAPTRILTHFESDSAAAPKVQMAMGQQITSVVPDFKSERWLGLLGEIAACPDLPACRTQIEVRFDADSRHLAEQTPGFHWFTCYGNWLRETGYALKKVPIAWEGLG